MITDKLIFSSVLCFNFECAEEMRESRSSSPRRAPIKSRLSPAVALAKDTVVPIRRDLNIFGTNIASERINAVKYSKHYMPEGIRIASLSINPDLGSRFFGFRNCAIMSSLSCPSRDVFLDIISASSKLPYSTLLFCRVDVKGLRV